MNHAAVYNLKDGNYHEFAPLAVARCLVAHVQWKGGHSLIPS